MSEIDKKDDDALRFVQRVLESQYFTEVDRLAALDMVRAIRKRVLKEYAAGQRATPPEDPYHGT